MIQVDANLTYISSVCFNKKNVLMCYCTVKKVLVMKILGGIFQKLRSGKYAQQLGRTQKKEHNVLYRIDSE